jgi:Raf kinase inhibitor-like YbhB/YbcL family protein
MKISSTGIVNGVIADRYGKRGETTDFGMPVCSLPVSIEDAPDGTVCYALFLEDKDAFPVSGGFSWVHWVAANITTTTLEEDAARRRTDFVQGLNSWTSVQGGNNPPELCAIYGGMSPPDQAHIYELTVYALDKKLDLEDGFLMNHMFRQMDGHILAQATIKGEYDA